MTPPIWLVIWQLIIVSIALFFFIAAVRWGIRQYRK